MTATALLTPWNLTLTTLLCGVLLSSTPTLSKTADSDVGFYILGASLTNLKHSMDQRIQHATALALGQHSNDNHVYFLSGYKNPNASNGQLSEAEYMEREIRRIYTSRSRPVPQFRLDYEARFTVMNFLKTIPIINEFQRDLRKRKSLRCVMSQCVYLRDRKSLRCVYMVTSDYHMSRSLAILNEFRKARLTGDVRYVPAPAPHPKGPQFDKWLLSEHNGRTRLDDILDASRDRDNAEIFATLCAQRMTGAHNLKRKKIARLATGDLVARYLKNNGANTPEKCAEKKQQLEKLVGDFVEAN